MPRSLRRGLAAAAVVVGLVGSAPGAVMATTSCGLVVCADAAPTAVWACTTVDDVYPGWDEITCIATGTAAAAGFSPMSVPGSLTWDGSTKIEYSFDGGATWTTFGGSSTPASTCTWAGLGEDTCGGAGPALTWGFGSWIPHGQCWDSYYGWDIRISATANAVASKTLPLALATVDSATASETKSKRISTVPASERCAFA